MTILVTGATRNVGSRLIPHLLTAGRNVRAIVRRDKAGLPDDVERVKADLLDPKTLLRRSAGSVAWCNWPPSCATLMRC